jgi:hypothetical protein
MLIMMKNICLNIMNREDARANAPTMMAGLTPYQDFRANAPRRVGMICFATKMTELSPTEMAGLRPYNNDGTIALRRLRG